VRSEALPEIPKNLEAERQVLSACLLNDAERGRVFEQLGIDDFTAEPHREVFRAMRELESAHQEISVFTLQNSLLASRAVQDAGGIQFISALVDNKSWGSVETQCRIIRQESTHRKMQALGYATEAVAVDRSKSILDIVSDVEERFSEIRDDYLSTSRGAVHVSQVLQELQPALDRAWNGHGALLGISTGYPALDRVVPGLEPGAMVVLASLES
jgi:replicative DNA helicase